MIKRLMSILFVVALVSMVFSVGSCDKIKKIPGTVAGQLMNEAGQGMGFVAVHLVEVESGKTIASENADDNGNFMFKNVESGTYRVMTTPIGGGELPNDCDEFKLAPGKTLNLSITVQFGPKE